MIKLKNCIEGSLYKVDGRNFDLAIFYKGKFYGVRYKFGTRFIDQELHWDSHPRYGTVKPLEFLEKVSEKILNNEKIMEKYLKEKRYEYDID